MTPTHTLGDLQLAIMRILWRQREATVTEVHRDQAGRTEVGAQLRRERAAHVIDRGEGRDHERHR